MNLTTLRLAVRRVARDGATLSHEQEPPMSPQLTPTERASLRALERVVRRAHGDAAALIPTRDTEEWFFSTATRLDLTARNG